LIVLVGEFPVVLSFQFELLLLGFDLFAATLQFLGQFIDLHLLLLAVATGERKGADSNDERNEQ
jgi:hypothetical protein